MILKDTLFAFTHPQLLNIPRVSFLPPLRDFRFFVILKDTLFAFTHPQLLNIPHDLSYGLDRFRDSDWRGCIHTIYPKIEGILRSILIYRVCEYPEDCSFDESEGNCSNCNCSVGYNYFRSEDSLKQAASGFKTGGTSSSGISIREFMENYLSNFYFADFPYFRTKTKLSRHSLAHGVVDPEEFNFENAINGILILNEIFFNQD